MKDLNTHKITRLKQEMDKNGFCIVENLIDTETIGADTHLDVMDGAAGVILALLILHESSPSDALLEKARHCATHMLNRRAESGVR